MTSTDPTRLPVLDDAIVCELRDLMEEDFDELLETFLRDMPRHLRHLQTAIAGDDSMLLWQAAHPLKSSSGSVGALRLSALAEQLEKAGRSGTAASAAPLLGRLQDTAEQTRAALQALLA